MHKYSTMVLYFFNSFKLYPWSYSIPESALQQRLSENDSLCFSSYTRSLTNQNYLVGVNKTQLWLTMKNMTSDLTSINIIMLIVYSHMCAWCIIMWFYISGRRANLGDTNTSGESHRDRITITWVVVSGFWACDRAKKKTVTYLLQWVLYFIYIERANVSKYENI